MLFLGFPFFVVILFSEGILCIKNDLKKASFDKRLFIRGFSSNRRIYLFFQSAENPSMERMKLGKPECVKTP